MVLTLKMEKYESVKERSLVSRKSRMRMVLGKTFYPKTFLWFFKESNI